jgi:dTDP-4-amino-4,6-dideoxy-D-galactose acyltransferase
MTHPDEICERLEWDSAFFGLPIARVRVNRLTESDADRVEAWVAAHGIRCLYLLADLGDMPTIRLAEQRGYRLVDVKMLYEVELAVANRAAPPSVTAAIRPAVTGDIEALRAIAISSYRGTTRFYHDPGFTAARCDELYATWIEQSVRGWADQVLVIGPAGAPHGFITCHRNGHVGLAGVRSDMRGQGAGRALYRAALDWFAAEGIGPVRLVVPGANLASQRVCHRIGAHVADVALWYHRWFPPQP